MIITRTPLRISFTGGGTDICDYYRENGGAVVSAAINKYIYITISSKFDNQIRISYSKTEIVPEVKEIHHELVRESLKLLQIHGGIEIVSIADIPSGTGLGSSSSFTVGLLNALMTYTGERASAQQLAELACKVEIDILKHPIGKQDQYAAALGGLNFLEFRKDDTVHCQRIDMNQDDLYCMERKLMMFYTGITRSADKVLTEQKKNTKQKLETLDFMRNQAYEMRDNLAASGFTDQFAKALREGWEKKRTLASSITNEEINTMLQKAQAAGAKGGKLLGAGGGGFLLLYCDEEKQRAVADTLALQQTRFMIEPYGSRVIYFA